MKRVITLCALFLTLLTALSCGKEKEIPVRPGSIYLRIASTTKDCNGPFPRKCLQVKENDSPNWEYFYDYITGFTYEEGYEYELFVKRETVANPPADGSSFSYTLVEEISKTKR